MIKRVNINTLHRIVSESIHQLISEEEEHQNLYTRWLDLQKKYGSEKVLYAVWKELDTDEIESIIKTMEELNDGVEDK